MIGEGTVSGLGRALGAEGPIELAADCVSEGASLAVDRGRSATSNMTAPIAIAAMTAPTTRAAVLRRGTPAAVIATLTPLKFTLGGFAGPAPVDAPALPYGAEPPALTPAATIVGAMTGCGPDCSARSRPTVDPSPAATRSASVNSCADWNRAAGSRAHAR
jgi:hypothetical protein